MQLSNTIVIIVCIVQTFYCGREWRIGHFRNLGIGLELACNGGLCGEISLKRDECDLHLKRLPAFASVES